MNQYTTIISLQDNEDKLYQLSFSDNLRLTIGLILTSLADIVITPHANTQVRNKPVTITLSDEISKFKMMINEVPSKLRINKFEYDQTVEEILFQDFCQYLQDTSQLMCRSLQKGRVYGLVEALSNLEFFVKEEILNPTERDLEEIMIQYLVMKEVFDSLFDALEQNFNATIDFGISSNEILNYAMTSALIIFSIAVHISVLRNVGQTDSNFKRALETFPVKLVLSNYTLKSFILRTSRRTLDTIKDEI